MISTVTKTSTATASKPTKISPAMSKKKTEAPLFLAKTYAMVDTSNDDIVSWSEKGDMFIIKDHEIFASTVIPKFFKHSNFSSFVRQLNFYGFRKIRTEAIFFDKTSLKSQQEAKYWRFRHEKFLKGRPELLVEMRRDFSKTSPAALQQQDKQLKEDVINLKNQVQMLENKLKTMTDNVESLTQKMSSMSMQQQAAPVPTFVTSSSHERNLKKRKQSTSSQNLLNLDTEDSNLQESEVAELTNFNDEEFAELNALFGNEDNIPNIPLDDNDINEKDDNVSQISSCSSMGVMPSLPTSSNIEANLPLPTSPMNLKESLEMLPESMQQMFVEKLVCEMVRGTGGDVSNTMCMMMGSALFMNSKALPPLVTSNGSDGKNNLPFVMSCKA